VGALFQLDPRADAEAFALLYNYLFFVVPFYAGLHITYMDKNLFLRAVGDKAPHLLPPGNCNQRVRVLGLTHLPSLCVQLVVPSRWKTYTKKELIALAVLLGFLLFVASCQVILLVRTSSFGPSLLVQPPWLSLSGCIWSRLSMAFCSGTRWPTGVYWRPSA
jgi:hypothetical protein